MTFLDWLFIAAATLYLSEVITGKDGPGGIFKRLRELDRTGLLSCIWCFVLWGALAMSALYYFVPEAVQVIAVAGLAMIIRSYSGVSHGS